MTRTAGAWGSTALVALSLAVFVTGASPSASAFGVDTKKCTPGLTSGVLWDHADPQYMMVKGVMAWKNCHAAIRKLTLELRMIDAQGGLVDWWRNDISADVVHKPSGRQTYSAGSYLAPEYGFQGSTMYDPLKSCGQRASGALDDRMSAYTYYTLARAYDRKGRVILEKVSPSVACDQNG